MNVQNTSSTQAMNSSNHSSQGDGETWSLPVDKALPKETVMYYFLDHYKHFDNKGELAKNSIKTKRIREAYWSLFGCIALDVCEGVDHLLMFLADDRNDVSYLSQAATDTARPKANYMEFDVKEYTQYSAASGFNTFIGQAVKPSLHLYGLILGVQCDIREIDISSLFFEENTRGIILVHSSDGDTNDPLRAKVTFILGNEVVLNMSIDLRDYIEYTEERVVMQNTLRGLPR